MNALPQHCPRCEAASVVGIVYGLPTPELEEASLRGEVVLGGCIVPQPHKWCCSRCDYRWPLSFEVLQSELVAEALEFAYQAHAGQRRKGDDTPYADHPIEVAHLLHEEGFDETVVAAGLLHDVVEDTIVTLAEIWARFGPEVAGLVETATEDKAIRDYAERKAQHREKVRAVGTPAAAIFAGTSSPTSAPCALRTASRGRRSASASTLRWT